jgi:hypothetical protein
MERLRIALVVTFAAVMTAAENARAATGLRRQEG